MYVPFYIGDKERELAMPLTFAYDRHNPVPESKFQLVNNLCETQLCSFD